MLILRYHLLFSEFIDKTLMDAVYIRKLDQGTWLCLFLINFGPYLTALDQFGLIWAILSMGWEPMLLMRAFGLSKELSTKVGFAFSNNGLKF